MVTTLFAEGRRYMQHCDSLFHAARILTQDAGRTILEDAALAVRDGQIAAVGPLAELECSS